ncbi:metallophosphoesterase [Sorangium sp. So ce134]
MRFVSEGKDRLEARSLVELVEARRSVVVLGDPGMGKTTLLLFLSLLCAGAADLPGCTAAPHTPLFISLRDLAQERVKDPELHPIDFLARRAQTDLGLKGTPRELFDALLRLGQATVLLDGLDEVGTSATRVRMARDIRALQSEYPRCPMWVTSRMYGYTPDFALPVHSFEHVRVGPLDDNQVRDFLGRWYAIQIPDNDREREEHRASLEDGIFRDAGVRRLAGNPLLLTLTAFIHRVLGHLPQDRAKLYDQCIEMLLRSWLEAKRRPGGEVERHPFEVLGIHQERQKEYLAYLALHMQQKTWGGKEEARGLIEREEVLDHLAQRHLMTSRRLRPHLDLVDAREEMRRFLDYIGDRAGLLLDRGGGKLSFLHLTFQEYLAAWAFTCASEEPCNPGVFVDHLGDPTWEQVLLLGLYLVYRKPGGERAFDRLVEAMFGALERRDTPQGWLTLTRALRDGLGFLERDRLNILRKAVEHWCETPAFSGPWFTALQEVKLFSPAAASSLADLLAERTRKGQIKEAVLCLHLTARLFGLDAKAVAGVEENRSLPELLPHLAMFLEEPALAPLLAERVTVEAWSAAIAALDGPEMYRLSLGWATGRLPAPSLTAVHAAIGWMRAKLSEEAASRRTFAAMHAHSDAQRLFTSPGCLRIRAKFHEVQGPLAWALLLEEPYVQPGPSTRSPGIGTELAVELLGGRLDDYDALTQGLRQAITPLIAEQLRRFVAFEPLPESTAISISDAFVRDFSRSFGRSFNSDFVRSFGRDFVRSFGSSFGRDFVRSFGSSFERFIGRYVVRDFARNFVRDFGSSFGSSFGRDFGPSFGRSFGRSFGSYLSRDFGREFIQDFVQRFGRDLGIPAGTLDVNEQIDQALQDDFKTFWLVQQPSFWELWIRMELPVIESAADSSLERLRSDLRNPLALPLFLADLWTLAANHHLFCCGRYLASSNPEGIELDENISAWFLRHPVEVHAVGWAWEEHAAAIEQHQGGLRGLMGALALLHAQYVRLMTGLRIDAEGTNWRRLLDQRDPDIDRLLNESLSATSPSDTSSPTPPPNGSAQSRPPTASQPVASARPPPEPLFTWLHLSDVHFGHRDVAHRWDQKLVLPRLLEEIRTFRDNSEIALPRIDAILVTGDIAWSGKLEQYDQARTWLKQVAHAVGLELRHVFAVPGNHDVDRDLDKERALQRLLRSLRDGRDALDDALCDPADRSSLARRQGAYLKFAADLAPVDLGTPQPPEARLWWSSSLTVHEGLQVRLVGLNTALLAADDQDRGKLCLGKEQLATTLLNPPPNSDELVVVLSHHPFVDGWLADQRDVDREVQSTAHLHLSGHVHEHENNAYRGGSGMGMVRIVAGAVHGDKQPQGVIIEHGFSFGAVVRGNDNCLRARVFPRRFSDKNRDCRLDGDNVPKGQYYAEHIIPRLRRA